MFIDWDDYISMRNSDWYRLSALSPRIIVLHLWASSTVEQWLSYFYIYSWPFWHQNEFSDWVETFDSVSHIILSLFAWRIRYFFASFSMKDHALCVYIQIERLFMFIDWDDMDWIGSNHRLSDILSRKNFHSKFWRSCSFDKTFPFHLSPVQ